MSTVVHAPDRSEPPRKYLDANVPMVSAPDVDLVQVRWRPGFSSPPIEDLPVVRGRRSEIDALTATIRSSPGRIHLLGGPAGCGKTTIALAVARDLREGRRGPDDAPGTAPQHPVYWVPARNRSSFLDGMVMVAGDLGADEVTLHRAREEGTAAAAWSVIGAAGRAPAVPPAGPRPEVLLLVIDNADDPVLRADVIRAAARLGTPDHPSRWFVLITTRADDELALPGHGATVTGVDVPPVAVAADILLDRIPGRRPRRDADRAPAEEAARLLGRLPLALHLAGSHLGSNLVRHRLEQYVEHVRRLSGDRGPGAGAGGGARPGPARHLVPVLSLAVESLGEAADTARTLLRLLAVLGPPQPIPDVILDEELLHVSGLLTGQAAESLWTIDAAVRSLKLLKLVEPVWHPESDIFVVHPLIAEASRLWLGRSRAAGRIVGAAARIVDEVTASLEPGRPDRWPEWQLLVPHVMALLAEVDAAGDGAAVRPAVRSAVRIARHLLSVGMYRAALSVAGPAETLARRLPRFDPDRLEARHQRALVYQARGFFPTAEADFAAVAAARARVLGATDRQTLRSRHCFAVIVYERGDLALAERLFRAVLRDRRRLVARGRSRAQQAPADLLDLLTTMQCLANVLHAAGRPRQAQTLLDRVLAVRRDRLGPDHPDTLVTLHALAYALQAIGGPGSLDSAERLFRDVFAARVRRLGETHPNTLLVRANLAWIKQARNDHEHAQRDFEEVLEVQTGRLGEDHPHTLATKANLAWVLLQRGRYARARALFEQVRTVRMTRLGPNHPDTQTTRGNLGWLTLEEGHAAEAERILRRLHRDRIRWLGARHPRTLTTKHNLALSLRQQDTGASIAKAEEMFREVLEVQENVIGPEHASTVATMNNLALTIRAGEGDLAVAEGYLRRVVDIQSRTSEPGLLTTLNNLIFILRAVRKDKEADKLERRLAALHQRAAVERSAAARQGDGPDAW